MRFVNILEVCGLVDCTKYHVWHHYIIFEISFHQQFQCVCKIGFGGDGNMCAPDSDLDSWPDHSLNCTGNNMHCKADNCIFIPNSGQEDSDKDGIGDFCIFDFWKWQSTMKNKINFFIYFRWCLWSGRWWRLNFEWSW